MNHPEPDDASLAELVRLMDVRDGTERGGAAGGNDDDRADGEADDLLRRLANDLPGPPPALRALLAVIGIAQAFLVVPWLVGSDPFDLLPSSGSGHLTRDGSFGLVVAAAALLTAWRPRWAVPSFTIASIALVAQTAAGFIDEAGGHHAAGELIHLPSVVLTCLVGLSAVRLPPLGPRRRSIAAVPDPPADEGER